MDLNNPQGWNPYVQSVQPPPAQPVQPLPAGLSQQYTPTPPTPSYSQPPPQFNPGPPQVYYSNGQPVQFAQQPQQFQPPPPQFNPSGGWPTPQQQPVGPVTYQPPPPQIAPGIGQPFPTPNPYPQTPTQYTPGTVPGVPPGSASPSPTAPPGAPTQQDNPYARLGQTVAAALGTLPQDQQRPAWQPPDFDPRLIQNLFVTDAKGQTVPRPGADPMLVAKAQQWASWWDDWEQNSFRRNPYDALKPGLEPWIREQARAVLQETVAQQRDQQAVQSFQQRHADWLYHKGPDGRPLANPQQPGQFVLSPVGQRFAQHLGQAEGLGIRNAADQLRYAEAMFESELARRAAQAPAVPPPQTGPQALAALAQQNPLAAAQQAVFSPGLFAPQQQNQAPGMTYSQPQGLSFDALAAAGTQPAMPPGAGYLPGGTPYAGQHPGTVQAQGFSAPSPFGLTMGQLLERNAVAAGLMQPTPGTQPGSLW